MRRESIAYLQALGIDVWLPKNQTVDVSSNAPATRKPSHDRNETQPSLPTKRQRSTNEETRANQTTIKPSDRSIPRTKPITFRVCVQCLGKVAAIYGEPRPANFRFVEDVAFFLNDYQKERTPEEWWQWQYPSITGDQVLDEDAKRGLFIWLSRRVNKCELLVVFQQNQTEIIESEFDFQGLQVSLNTQVVSKLEKMDLWERLQTLRT